MILRRIDANKHRDSVRLLGAMDYALCLRL